MKENHQDMLSHESAIQVIQKSFDSLQRAGLVAKEVSVQDSTVLLGSGSPFDSIAFVTFITELEDRLNREENRDDLYRVLNDISTGNSFIVISSENAEINGMVYLIKGGTLFAATPNQRSFVRLGSLNLDRRVSGSLFSHWDLQGNIPIGTEYTPTIVK